MSAYQERLCTIKKGMTIDMTQKLYDSDAYLTAFSAEVLACWEDNQHYRVILDRTAFFPEQGGQYADTGMLGDAKVLDAQLSEGAITHICDRYLAPHTHITGIIDWEKRYDRMQNHSGEHLVSGLIHTIYNFDNVGFHLGDEDMTLDINGVLTREQLSEIEEAANEAVWKNLPVMIDYPDTDTLASLSYRSKLELTENVRIVTFPGYDVCACCAPHVHATGEIGLIKILDAIHYKGGMRIHVRCGKRALYDYRTRYENTAAIAVALHGKQEETAADVARLLSQLSSVRSELSTLKKDLLAMKTETIAQTDGNLCFIEAMADISSLRSIVNAGAEKCGGICAAFSGNDREGYLFVIGSKNIPLRARAKEITAALSGRGGGTDLMISGSVSAPAAVIRAYIESFR